MANLWDYLSNIPDVAKSLGTGLVNAGAELADSPANTIVKYTSTYLLLLT